jgi:hypothetical protein
MYTELLSATVIILLSYALFVHLVLPFYAAVWQDVLRALEQQRGARRWKRITRKI